MNGGIFMKESSHSWWVKRLLFLSSIFFSILLIFSSFVSGGLFDNIDFNYFQLIVAVTSIVAIIITKKYQISVENSYFDEVLKKYIAKIKLSIVNNYVHNSRSELRFGLNILFFFSILCILFINILRFDIITFIFSALLLIIGYMYADYIPHSNAYAKLYDSKFSIEPTAIKGLSRIYKDEYDKTKFKKSNSFYQTDCFSEEDKKYPKHQILCMKNILWCEINRTNDITNIISYICVFLNVIFIIPNALNNIVVQFLQKVSVIINVPTAEMIGNKQIDLIIIILLNITFTVSNIIGISKHEEKCKNIYEIGSALLGENEYKDISKVYDNEFKKHKINNVIIARGRFTYSSQYISNHKNTIEDIPLKYRMWFIDKEQANIPRLKITVILSFFAVCMLLLQFQCSVIIFVANIFAHVLAYIVTRIFILSRIGKRNIIKNM